MKRALLALLLLTGSLSFAQLQSPAEFLGYQIGTQFSRHADVVRYFEHVAANSDMATYQTYGKTNERRPLTYAVVSSRANLNNLEAIRTAHLKNAGIGNGAEGADKAIVWLSYNVHGNEASATESALTTLYQLVTQKQDWLENTVVIIDPCINPDGRDRYANWYNQVKATPYNTNRLAAEHNEPWPGGRPNHYLFDLNRDWAWATQVESQQRIKVYNQWLPHVHVDFHEQGINEPYYFAPAAEPFHEVITDWQRDFQTQIGKNHAKYFDKEGWLFFTRERFDLLYPSYGDTYPTFLGGIGMTYEQAGHGRAGLGINNDEGIELTLVDRVAHHTTTGLSTVEISSMNAAKLNEEFKKFFSKNDFKYKSYVLNGHADKIQALTKLLDLHEIEYGFKNSGSVSGFSYKDNGNGSIQADGALVVRTDQPKATMVKVLFEPDAYLSNPLTYDITAWSVPHAYGLDCVASTSLISADGTAPFVKTINQVMPNAVGYLMEWKSNADATFLAEALQMDIRVRFSEKKLRFNGRDFDRGTLVITKSDNRKLEDFAASLTSLANKHARVLVPTTTSFSDNGTDFGSPDIKLVTPSRVAVLRGSGTSSLSYGTVWHYFETQLKYPITSMDTDDFDVSDLEDFDVLILPSGWYSRVFRGDALDELKAWVRNGGKLIAIDRALGSFDGKDGFVLETNKGDDDAKEDEDDNLTPYDQREKESVKDFITGSIYQVTLDQSHPMAFGFEDTYFSLKQGSRSYQFLDSGYNVGIIKGEPVSVSGFSGDDAKAGLKNSLVFGEARMGRGSVIYLVDDVLFRSFWENGKLFVANSLFFVNSQGIKP